MQEENEDYKDAHLGIECYECNVWISRLIIGIMFQTAIAIAWSIFVCRHVKQARDRLLEPLKVVD